MEILLTSMLSLTFRLVWVDGWMVFGEPWWKQGFPSSPFYPSYFPPNKQSKCFHSITTREFQVMIILSHDIISSKFSVLAIDL